MNGSGRRWREPLAAFALALAVFAALAGGRLAGPSRDAHFVWQAQAWLEGRLDVEPWPPGADDPARLESVRLDDGSRVRGRFLHTRPVFRVAGGDEIPSDRVVERLGVTHYVAFPPGPAVVLLPLVAVAGRAANDVVVTVLLAALAPALLLGVLRRLRRAGLSSRTSGEECWLAALLAFGTVFAFCAVQGRVWFTAHVLAVDLTLAYVWASVGAARPFWAGAALALAFVTRPPLLFMFPLFGFEVWRVRRAGWRRCLVAFGAPVLLVGGLAAWHNHARFGEPTEFGHRYLDVVQSEQIERDGLFGARYAVRNLSVLLGGLPELSLRPPRLRLGGHGLALWITTPAFLLLLGPLLRPRQRGAWHRPLWITVACVAPWTLAYQNTGWIQFGQRFSLDYTVFLVLLLAVGGRPFDRWLRALVVWGIAVNLFGAATFGRCPGLYATDRDTYRSLPFETSATSPRR